MEDSKNTPINLYYACCPICKTILIQAANGLNGFVLCKDCRNYVHITIQNGIVRTRVKDPKA